MTSSSLKMHTPQICECSEDLSGANSMAPFAHFLCRREKCRRGGLHSICFHCTQAIFFPPFQKISCLLHMREKLKRGKNLFFVYPAGEYTLQHHAEEALGGLNNISAVKSYNLETLTIRTQCQQYLNKHPRQQNNGY